MMFEVLTDNFDPYETSGRSIHLESKVANDPGFRPDLKDYDFKDYEKDVMIKCWDHDPRIRYNFKDIHDLLDVGEEGYELIKKRKKSEEKRRKEEEQQKREEEERIREKKRKVKKKKRKKKKKKRKKSETNVIMIADKQSDDGDDNKKKKKKLYNKDVD